MPNEVYNDAFYSNEAATSLRCAYQVVPLLQDMFSPSSILDVGCGVGAFLRSFRDRGVQDHLGLDGDYVPRDQRLIEESAFKSVDLSKPFDLGRRYDMVMSLEVGEHLDAAVADDFVRSICRHGDLVVFSAAIPVQMGDHHVNEQWQSYWVGKFRQCGFYAFDALRPKIWANNDIEVYYKQNILVFANEAGIGKYPKALDAAEMNKDPRCFDMVHPQLYELRVGPYYSLVNFLQQMANAGRPFLIKRNPDGGYSADVAA